VELKEQLPQFTGQACKFVNLSPVSMLLYWDGPEQPIFNSLIGPWGSGGTACFASHRFFLIPETNEGTVIWSSAWSQFTVTRDTSVYFYNPYEDDVGYESLTESMDAARGIDIMQERNQNSSETNETSFPRWRNAETTGSLDVQPEKGKAMIFYIINPDGNLDDLTLHAALPVREGGKYFVNLWISSY
jgi:hypothetical protein